MANYSSDTDLSLYEKDIARLGSLGGYHIAAKTEIDRRLKNNQRVQNAMDAESKTDPADILSADTVSALKVVSCYYALFLAYNAISISAMDEYGSKAAMYEKMYHSQFKDTQIEIDTDADTYPEDIISSDSVGL